MAIFIKDLIISGLFLNFHDLIWTKNFKAIQCPHFLSNLKTSYFAHALAKSSTCNSYNHTANCEAPFKNKFLSHSQSVGQVVRWIFNLFACTYLNDVAWSPARFGENKFIFALQLRSSLKMWRARVLGWILVLLLRGLSLSGIIHDGWRRASKRN